jgi:flagellar biosynthesis/type III secretory pathway M-ring protein FliF/YscJ
MITEPACTVTVTVAASTFASLAMSNFIELILFESKSATDPGIAIWSVACPGFTIAVGAWVLELELLEDDEPEDEDEEVFSEDELEDEDEDEDDALDAEEDELEDEDEDEDDALDADEVLAEEKLLDEELDELDEELERNP